ncbi:oxysterol-binding protein [Tanacetum coccineum]|uniref:Oxysterol-binding protein n=1 Tax=Tanacetum coccineum TaxID=301880 RepID=A0ABQ5EIH7_9ASTR
MESSDEKTKKLLGPTEKENEVLPLIKDDVVKDLTQVDIAADFNEPISYQKKCLGDLEYSYSLDTAYQYRKKEMVSIEL